jgi:hypothetical protein
MNTASRSFQKKLLCASVASVLGLAASGPLSANTYELSFVGAFTMINGSGSPVPNRPSPYASGINDPYGWYGNRTPITGTMTYDTATGVGSAAMNGFQFFGSTPQQIALVHGITFQNIGNGTCTNNTYPPSGCQPGNLLLGNMLFHWNSAEFPVSIVWDAQGFLGALPGAIPGAVIQGVGALSGSDGTNFGTEKIPMFFPLGATPIATTTWNTTSLCTDPFPGSNICLGVNPSGTLPLIADSVSGSPIIGTVFSGYNINLDFMKLTVTSVTPVPLPAAFWLFGSGLLGLIGVARRKAS